MTDPHMPDPHMPDPPLSGGAARELLREAVPAPPPVGGWAEAAQGKRRHQRVLAGLTALVLVLVIPAAVVFLTRGAQTVGAGAGGTVFAGPGTEVAGEAMIYRGEGAQSPVLCLGPVLTSYPPQCGGPTLLGEFSWDEVEFEEASGVRWTNDYYRVQGFFDPADGEYGSLHLSAPLREPDNAELGKMEPGGQDLGGQDLGEQDLGGQDPGELDFPQLCDDPLRGADPALTGIEAENALHAELAQLNVVDVWVSNGRDAFNVVVRGDAEQVHAHLRTVWGGELCVETSTEATHADRVAAVEEIFQNLPPGQASSGGPAATTGGIDLELVYLDEAGAEVIREAASGIPVRVTTLLTPIGADRVVEIR